MARRGGAGGFACGLFSHLCPSTGLPEQAKECDFLRERGEQDRRAQPRDRVLRPPQCLRPRKRRRRPVRACATTAGHRCAALRTGHPDAIRNRHSGSGVVRRFFRCLQGATRRDVWPRTVEAESRGENGCDPVEPVQQRGCERRGVLMAGVRAGAGRGCTPLVARWLAAAWPWKGSVGSCLQGCAQVARFTRRTNAESPAFLLPWRRPRPRPAASLLLGARLRPEVAVGSRLVFR